MPIVPSLEAVAIIGSSPSSLGCQAIFHIGSLPHLNYKFSMVNTL